MIEFIQKEPFESRTAFSVRELIPVFMVKDGAEYFIINRVVKGSGYSAAYESISISALKEFLIKTDGAYVKFNGFYDDPKEMLAEMQERGHSFVEPDNLFVRCDGKSYGSGFTDFSGNRNEVSAAFYYRIYDEKLVDELKKLTIPITERRRRR